MFSLGSGEWAAFNLQQLSFEFMADRGFSVVSELLSGPFELREISFKPEVHRVSGKKKIPTDVYDSLWRGRLRGNLEIVRDGITHSI